MHVDGGDKQRFVNLDARNDTYEVHSIEVSDTRSPAHFITLFLKDRTPRQDGWAELSGLRKYKHHDPEIYHRGDEKTKWVIEAFSDKGSPWTLHFHITTKKAPQLSDLDPFKDQIPPKLLEEVGAYFGSLRGPRRKTKKG